MKGPIQRVVFAEDGPEGPRGYRVWKSVYSCKLSTTRIKEYQMPYDGSETFKTQH
jgi:hypothetical protein